MRVAILILAVLLPTFAFADDGAPAGGDDAVPAAAVAGASAQPPRPVVGPTERKRRGSMVGYIDDATIDDHVRVRFDVAGDNNVPDRAEFFYAQCGCNFAGAPGPGNPGAGDLVTDLRFQEFNVNAQYALKTRSLKNRIAVYGTIPVRFVQPHAFLGQTFTPPLSNTFTNSSGLGDIRAGVKAAIINDEDSTLTAQVEGFFQSGDAKKGLGTNHASIEFALLDRQKMSERAQLEVQVGDWHPISGSKTQGGLSYSGDVFFYGFGPSYEVYSNERVSIWPIVELIGWHVFGGQEQDSGVLRSAEGVNVVNIKVGARAYIDTRSSIYIGWGRALTDARWYQHIVRFEYRYSF
jgi:hypothetical protein